MPSSLTSEAMLLPGLVSSALFATDLHMLRAGMPLLAVADMDLLAYAVAGMGTGYAGADHQFQVQAMQLALDGGANPNHVRSQRSLLGLACTRQNPHLVALLLGKGALVNDPTPGTVPPLACAIECQNKPLINLLIENGADLNAVDVNGEPVFFRALDANRQNYLPRLVQAGADIHMVDAKGNTVLHAWVEAAHRLQRGMIDRDRRTLWKLINWGADPLRLDAAGRTARELATQRGHAEAAHQLAAAEAQVAAQALDQQAPRAPARRSSARL